MACNINAVPILIGYTNWEGIFNVLYSELEKTEPIHKDFEKFVPHGFNLQVGSMESKEIAQKIKEFYYKDSEPSSETLETFIKVDSEDISHSGVKMFYDYFAVGERCILCALYTKSYPANDEIFK